jgi:hypothetical protein
MRNNSKNEQRGRYVSSSRLDPHSKLYPDRDSRGFTQIPGELWDSTLQATDAFLPSFPVYRIDLLS